MKEIILIKTGEIALKGQNRYSFEDKLISNIRRRISPLGDIIIKKAQSAITLEPVSKDFDFEEAAARVGRIFGIAGFSRSCVCEKSIEDILEKAPVYLKDALETAKTFKVEAKRSDKKFPLKSPEICEELGGYLLSKFPHLTVDVHNPELTVVAEVRDYAAYVRGNQAKGAGGMPVGTGGRAAVLISGGIDSPVAAYMMSKRGVELTAVHFASPPYTSERAEIKVKELLKKVAAYAGSIKLFIVPFTKIQTEIGRNCPEEYFTVIMRRFMMRISEIIAKNERCKALITGESIGQVASQTMDAITCTDAVCAMPVFRPLIALDKDEIITVSRKIDTYDISIQPYEDCCTVFTPKHPRTRPRLDEIIIHEQKLDADILISEAAGKAETVIIYE